MGGLAGNGAPLYVGIFENTIDNDPSFVLPSAGTGMANYSPTADWSLQVNSPCINAGQADISGQPLDPVDFEGNPRNSFSRIAAMSILGSAGVDHLLFEPT